MLKIGCHARLNLPAHREGFPLSLSEMRLAGFHGIEWDRPLSPQEPVHQWLQARQLNGISCRYPTSVLTHSFEKEARRLSKFLPLAQGFSSVIFEEASFSIHRSTPLKQRPLLSSVQREALHRTLEALAIQAKEAGLTPLYRPALGTVIQTASEIEELMGHTATLGLVLDLVELELSHTSPYQLIHQFCQRIGLVRMGHLQIDPPLNEITLSDLQQGKLILPGDQSEQGSNQEAFELVINTLLNQGYTGWIAIDGPTTSPLPLSRIQLAYSALQLMILQANQGSRTSTIEHPQPSFATEP